MVIVMACTLKKLYNVFSHLCSRYKWHTMLTTVNCANQAGFALKFHSRGAAICNHSSLSFWPPSNPDYLSKTTFLTSFIDSLTDLDEEWIFLLKDWLRFPKVELRIPSLSHLVRLILMYEKDLNRTDWISHILAPIDLIYSMRMWCLLL